MVKKIQQHLPGTDTDSDKQAQLIEKLIMLVVEYIYIPGNAAKESFSKIMSKKLGYDYNYLSTLFSQVKNITLERFIILNKLDRVKNLIIYHDLNLSEIALKLNYSSIGHLSNQFKKMTGLTPSYFRYLKRKNTKFI